MKNFSVVDVETTGFGKLDKICEVAIVNVDVQKAVIVDEFETLIDPERDIGPVHIHRVTPTMVLGAPLFEDVASGIAEQLENSVIVAHNLRFDTRMLNQEFKRLKAFFDPGKGVCTLGMTREKLVMAAKRYQIEYHNHHTAIDDARVTAEIFLKLFEEYEKEVEPARIVNLETPPCAETLKRDDIDIVEETIEDTLVRQICQHTRFPTTEENLLEYLNLLDAVLDDLVITKEETKQIDDLVETLSISEADRKWANEVYLQTLVSATKRDGIVTDAENEAMYSVADILGVDQSIPEITKGLACSKYPEGTRVCFTGTACGPNGEELKREDLEVYAAKLGLQPVESFTKSGCDLLVAQDINSQSGKAKRARNYGKEIISIDEFLEVTDYQF